MILSYQDKKWEQFAQGEFVGTFQGFEDQAARRLSILDAALSLDALQTLPGNRLEALKGDRVGQYSIRINQQWRIGFEWPPLRKGEWAMFMRAVHPGEASRVLAPVMASGMSGKLTTKSAGPASSITTG
jgi:proteic killer suppression protein